MTCQLLRIILHVICIMNCLVKVMKKNGRPLKVWLGSLLFIKILLKTAQLLSKHFPSVSLCILYFLFDKGTDTSAIPLPSDQHLVYVYPIFFGFHKCFNNFYLSKNILINNIFYCNILCFFKVLPPCCKGVVSFSLK